MANPAFVGRERELGQLHSFLDRALAENGQIAFVAGEAGSGKSALMRTFADQVQTRYSDVMVALGNCNAQSGVGDPYLPFREVLAALTGLSGGSLAQPADAPAANRLKTFFVRSMQVLVETAPDLIGTFVPGGALLGNIGKAVADKAGWLDKLSQMAKRSPAPTAGAGPVLEQNRIFEQYTNVLLALAANRPLLLILDDLHWADEASISLLFHLSRRIEQSRILLVGAYRPDEIAMLRRDAEGNEQRHPLEKVMAELKRYVGDVWVDLGKVQADDGRTFTDQLIDAQPNRLDETFRTMLFARTSGNALFTVELLRTLQERGGLARDPQGYWVATPALDWETVPARVEGVLEERLGRLTESQRKLLGAASVEGEQFIVEVLAQIQQLALRQAFDELSTQLEKRHHLVREQGDLQLSERRLTRYRFVHVFFQQFCYQALGAAERRLLHGEVARTLEQLCADDLDIVSAPLAWHYEHAGLAKRAIAFYTRAAMVAHRVSATNQAIDLLNKGLALLAEVPASLERDRQELSLQMALAAAARAKSFVAPEVSRALNRAMELSRKMERGEEQFWPLWGLQQFHLAKGEIGQAQELVPRLLTIAEEEQSPLLLLTAHLYAGGTSYFLGDTPSALAHFAQGAGYYTAELSGLLVDIAGTDEGMHMRAGNALFSWTLGHASQALQEGQEVVALAGQLPHPTSQILPLTYLAMLHHLRREPDEALARAEAALVLAHRYEVSHVHSWSPILMRWAQAWTRPGLEEIGALRKALDDFHDTDVRLRWPYYLSMLAEVCATAGQPDVGLATIDEALAASTAQDEHWWDAELHRLRGELLLAQGVDLRQVEAVFQKAIGIARQQQALTLELRATVSLARLWRQSQTEQAGSVLSEIYGQFSEGFDTLDLQEAKALLDELS